MDFRRGKKSLEHWDIGIGRVETHRCGFGFPKQVAKSSVRWYYHLGEERRTEISILSKSWHVVEKQQLRGEFCSSYDIVTAVGKHPNWT